MTTLTISSIPFNALLGWLDAPKTKENQETLKLILHTLADEIINKIRQEEVSAIGLVVEIEEHQ